MDVKITAVNGILNLPKPVIGLAPMDGVTDRAFREITKLKSNPDIIFTEFTHVRAVTEAADRVLEAFDFGEIERPIVAQIYGAEPEYFYHIAKVVCALGFDGVDINMGCPARNVASSGAGAALIKTPDVAKEIIFQTQRGVADWVADGKLTGLRTRSRRAVEAMVKRNQERVATSSSVDTDSSNENESIGFQNIVSDKRYPIPVSIKTRIGYDEVVTEPWVQTLSKTNPDWISMHGRTLKQMYSGSADWDQLQIAVESTDLPVMVNGDVKTYDDANKILKKTGAAGVLVGRATFGNPWFFDPSIQTPGELETASTQEHEILPKPDKDANVRVLDRLEIFDALIEHTKLHLKYKPDVKAFVQLRKHFGWYVKGFDGAKELRNQLVRSNTLQEVEEVLKSF